MLRRISLSYINNYCQVSVEQGDLTDSLCLQDCINISKERLNKKWTSHSHECCFITLRSNTKSK